MSSRTTWLIGAVAVIALSLAGCGATNDAARPVADASTPSSGMAGMAGMSGMDMSPNPSAGGGTTNADVAPVTPLRQGQSFRTLFMPAAYTPSPPSGGTDDYRCFLVDPKLTKPAYLVGSQFLPNNAAIVHHAIFFKLEKKDVAAAEALDAKDPAEGYTCFSGTGIGQQGAQLGGAPWLAAWAPGGTESLAAKGTGYRMEPGTRIIMQVHYNLLATDGKAAGADRSGIRLRFVSGRTALQPLHTTLLVAPIELPCPAGQNGPLCDRDQSIFDEMSRFGQDAGATVAGLNLICNSGKVPRPGNTQHCDRPARQTMVVQAVAGHMHLLGRSIKVDLNPGTARAKTLLDVPVYNFDDQGARELPAPVTVHPGDDLRVTCTHDAGLRTQLPALRSLPPRYVLWGEGTSDEMCLGVVVWSAQPAS